VTCPRPLIRIIPGQNCPGAGKALKGCGVIYAGRFKKDKAQAVKVVEADFFSGGVAMRVRHG
jgi:hypothetical protein